MIWVDWVLLAVLTVSIVMGIFRGFTREILGLASWVLAIIAALALAPFVDDLLTNKIPTPSLRSAAAHGLVFFAGLIVGALITAAIVALVRKSPLSSVDRAIGGGFGLARGVLIALICTYLVGMTPARQDKWWSDSMFVGQLDRLASSLTHLLPDSWRKHAPTETALKPQGA
jgi:membrane protein required for colicin V production